jgi:hypothetical protein
MMDDARRLAASGNRKMTAPRWWNEPVSWVLRSRLHGLLSKGLMLITVRGRRTGRLHTLPVGYVEAPGAIYALVGDFETKQWWQNLEGCAPAVLILRGQMVYAHATVLDRHSHREEFERAFGLYREKFTAIRVAEDEVLMVRCALA